MTQLGPSRRLVGEREPSPPPIYDPLGDEAGLLVLAAPELSAADKLAWSLLRQRSQSGRRQVRISPREVGEHQGVTADAGRQRLKNLRDKHGLIVGTACSKSGLWTIELLDPRDVLLGAVRVVARDPQLTLPFEPTAEEALSESLAVATAGDAPSSSAGISVGFSVSADEEPPEEPSEEPPEDPRPASGLSGPSGLLVSPAHAHRPLTIRRPSGPSAQGGHASALAAEDPRRGTSGGSSDDLQPAGEADDLAKQIARRREQLGVPRPADELDVNRVVAIATRIAKSVPTEREQAQARERWIDNITHAVNDPDLKMVVKVKVACAIVRGDLDPDDVREIFAELNQRRREGKLTAPPGAYFVRAVQAQFRRHGLEWLSYHKPKPK